MVFAPHYLLKVCIYPLSFSLIQYPYRPHTRLSRFEQIFTRLKALMHGLLFFSDSGGESVLIFCLSRGSCLPKRNSPGAFLFSESEVLQGLFFTHLSSQVSISQSMCMMFSRAAYPWLSRGRRTSRAFPPLPFMA